MTLPQFLPWQHATAQRWLADQERFAHAWIIHGMQGIGKTQFARAAAASLLCAAPHKGLSCGECASCRWVASGNHPDLRFIRPDAVAVLEGDEAAAGGGREGSAPSREIRIDQLRSLNSWFNTKTHRGGWRVAVVYPAESLNPVSANAMLKILEEPPAATVFLLVAHAPDRLLPTLVSRCRRLPLAVPERDDSEAWLHTQGVEPAAAWLAASSQAPLRAQAAFEKGGEACPAWLCDLLAIARYGSANPAVGELADALAKEETVFWLDTLQRLFMDVLLVHHAAGSRYYPELASATGPIAAQASPLRLLETLRWLGRQKALAAHPLNERLLLHTTLQRVVLALAPGVAHSRS
ncbi:MAG: DNA polymerase III subunit delta' [Castellaniella sp.]